MTAIYGKQVCTELDMSCRCVQTFGCFAIAVAAANLQQMMVEIEVSKYLGASEIYLLI